MEPGFKPPCPSGLTTLAIILVAPSKLSWLHEWMNECTNYKHLNWEAWLNENIFSPKKLTVFISLGLCFWSRESTECSHWLRACCAPGTLPSGPCGYLVCPEWLPCQSGLHPWGRRGEASGSTVVAGGFPWAAQLSCESPVSGWLACRPQLPSSSITPLRSARLDLKGRLVSWRWNRQQAQEGIEDTGEWGWGERPKEMAEKGIDPPSAKEVWS